MVPVKVGDSLEPQVLNRAHRYPWQPCEWQPPTRHTVEILTKSTNEGVMGREKRQNKHTVQGKKQTAQPHMAGTHNMCDLRNPVCHLYVRDSLTTGDQHWLDFNSAKITVSHI